MKLSLLCNYNVSEKLCILNMYVYNLFVILNINTIKFYLYRMSYLNLLVPRVKMFNLVLGSGKVSINCLLPI